MTSVLMVIAPETFRDEEYLEPKAVLESAGARVVTASTAPGRCTGRFGAEAYADEAVSAVDPAAFDAVIFVGGGGSRCYFEDPVAHSLARRMLDSGKVVAAICIAPVILANAGLLQGVRATMFPSDEDVAALRAGGAEYTAASVEVDGRIITANGPESAKEFGTTVAEALGLL